MGLRGLVKKVVSIDYNAIDRFGEGEIITSKPKAFGSYIMVYDSIGNVIDKRDFYFRKRNISMETDFNEKGKRVKWISYDDDEKVTYLETYEYNEHGDLIKEVDLLDGDTKNITIKYNEQGQKVFEKKDFYTTTYKYEGKNLIEKTAIWKIGNYSSVDVTKYKYNNQNYLIEENSYDGVKKYEYDSKGNRTKYYKKDEKGKIECVFYKYDEYNRVIDVLTTNGEDYNNSDILSRVKNIYANNLTRTPYCKQIWNEKGELISNIHDVCFIVSGDTISKASLNKDNNITSIVRLVKKGNKLHQISYDIESDPTVITYNYINNKLVSQYDSEGCSIFYEYNKNELVKKTEAFRKSKVITLYDEEQETSITSYDEDNKVLWSKTLSYEGNAEYGKIIYIMDSKGNRDCSVEKYFINGKIAKIIETTQGIPVTSEYTYNEQGDVIEVKSTDGNLRKYVYEYDPFGNWTKRITYNKGSVSSVTERSLEYF